MAANLKPRQDRASDAAEPSPKRYRCKLETMSDVKREMSKLYRESRTGALDVAVCCKLVYVLSQVGKTIEIGDIEARLQALEGRLIR